MQSTIIHPADWTVELNTCLRANELLPNNLMVQLQDAGFDVNKSWAVSVGHSDAIDWEIELFRQDGRLFVLELSEHECNRSMEELTASFLWDYQELCRYSTPRARFAAFLHWALENPVQGKDMIEMAKSIRKGHRSKASFLKSRGPSAGLR
jgi:hypothetical protein